ncbi:MAG: hypothetical protein QOI88_3348 [Gammaproteobacteria bacterium]|jgi:hypothetical protein|nr:hypothetical protein [Gammaproteobacteria bacterium]
MAHRYRYLVSFARVGLPGAYQPKPLKIRAIRPI